MGRSKRHERENAWIRTIHPHYLQVRSMRPVDRPEFVRQVARNTRLAQNTVHRQFAALVFLDNEGIDPLTIPHGVALLSLETVAKIIRLDPAEGRKLLAETIDRRRTITELLRIYNEWYRHLTQHGGYQKATKALASLYALPEKPLPGRTMADSGLRHAVADTPRIPSKLRTQPSVSTGERLSLAIRRVFETGMVTWVAPFTVTYRSRTGATSGTRVEPLLTICDSDGSRCDVFVHNGHQHDEVQDLRVLYSIACALLSARSVYLYADEPRAKMTAELQTLIEASDLRLDVRSGLSLIDTSAVGPMDSAKFTDRIAVYRHFRVNVSNHLNFDSDPEDRPPNI